eukprot:UN05787
MKTALATTILRTLVLLPPKAQNSDVCELDIYIPPIPKHLILRKRSSNIR